MSKALIVYGGWDGHEPDKASAYVASALAERGMSSDRITDLDALCDRERLLTYDVIVPCFTCGTLSGDQEQALCSVVEGGVGLGGWHGGIVDAFRSNTTYQFMTGGQFVAHPGNIFRYRVNITDREHPIAAGIDDFDVASEQYYMHVDPGVRVLASTTFDGRHEGKDWIKGVVMPTVWTKPWGRGRVFVSAIGHVTTDLQLPQVRELTVRGILWAAGKL